MEHAPPSEPYVDPVGVGLGFQEVVYGPTPAAGADFVYTVPGQYITVPVALTFRYVTSGVAGSRFLSAEIRDGNSVLLAFSELPSQHGPGATVDYSFMPNGLNVQNSTDSRTTNVLPSFPCQPGWQIAVGIRSKDAGDQLSRIALVVDRFLTGEHARRLRHRHEHHEHHGRHELPAPLGW